MPRSPRLSLRRKKARIVKLQDQHSDSRAAASWVPRPASPGSADLSCSAPRFSPDPPDGRLAFGLDDSPLRLDCHLAGHVRGKPRPRRIPPGIVRSKMTEACQVPRRDRSHEEIPGMTKRLINDDRYAFVLLKETVDQISDSDAQPAWDRPAPADGADPGGQRSGCPL